jgi:hypothetical protein
MNVIYALSQRGRWFGQLRHMMELARSGGLSGAGRVNPDPKEPI